MAAVRQTQTVVQTQSQVSGGGPLLQPHPLDNSLDALLEDLQTSVSRGRGAMNGPSGGVQHQEYREVRQVRQHVASSGSPHVQYLSPANPTTVVAEREPSPLLQTAAGEQKTVSYKTVSYQYNTSDGQAAGHTLNSSVGSPSDQASDVRLRENLNELDSLLVDLHQAQKAGFGSPQGSTSTTVNRVDVSRTGVDPGLLEPLDTSTPAPPTRQQQHMSRSVQYRQYSSARSASADGSGGTTPQLQPQRSTSAQRELVYEPSPPARSTRTRSPSPVTTSVTRKEVYYETDGSTRYRDKSPSNRRLQKEVYYETKDSTPYPTTVRHEVYYDTEPAGNVPPSSRHEVYYETERSSTLPPPRQDVYYEHKTSTLPPQRQEVYYDTKTSTLPPSRHDVYYETKTSPAVPTQRQEVYYETRNTSKVLPSPRPERYREPSPPPHRLQGSPPVDSMHKPDTYAPHPGTPATSVTSYRTYNYNASNSSVTQPPYPSPAPVPDSRLVYPDTSPPLTSDYPHSPPMHHSSPPPSTVVYREGPPHQPPTKVTTTVRTYTYELPGEPGVVHTHPYPPSPEHPYPDQQPNKPNVEHTVTYHVSSQQPPEKEPLLPTHHQPLVVPAEPNPPPTVITYKYSTHSSHNTTNKYPASPRPEEQQPLLPRPFPTASPGADYPPGGQPPKRLDDLMASFSDAEPDLTPQPKYYNVEKQMASSPPHAHGGPTDNNAVAVVTPTQNLKVEETKAKTEVKERERTVNKPGPPVFYPPGVELFSKKEESMAMRSSGKMARGKYKYEAASESKMKSSSSGGAAVVPVCLPLCCAMPCVIM